MKIVVTTKMTILDAIASSPINVFFTIVIGIGLAYLYYRKPSSSSGTQASSSSSSIRNHHHHHHNHFATRAFLQANATIRSGTGIDAGLGVVDEELQRSLALIERQERDMIRQEQDAAYQQSLKADREKRLKKEEEQRNKEARERAEKDERENQERLHQRLTQLKSEIRERLPKVLKGRGKDLMSSSNDAENIVKLVFKLPDGTRIKKDFCKHDQVKYLHWFVFSQENAPLQFRMTTNFPKRDLPGRPPLPEDFPGVYQEQHELEQDISKSNETTTNNSNSNNRSSSEQSMPETGISASTTTTTSTSTSVTTASNTTSVEANCELTLAEAGLTETQIIFVYDLEA